MIQLTDVSAGYGEVEVLKHISFTIEDNQNLCIIGPNGCGKTTLLKTIAGLLHFTGEIKLNGQPIREWRQHEFSKRLAMMTQTPGIYFSYSVFDTVMMGRYAHREKGFFGSISRKDTEVVLACLRTVDLLELKEKEISELSGGQLQRVFLARTLAQEPEVILLDEPTNHLDIKYQVELVDYLKEWSKVGKRTVVGVFHDINLAMRLTENIMVMHKGQIAGSGKIGKEISLQLLERVYQLDIASYMKNAFAEWDRL